jgi:glycosyltransferase involved in cell wall biosynthesis
MSVLFGHPTGNPNSHHAALAHFEAGRLEALCIPWMPSEFALAILRRIPRLGAFGRRLARRHFEPLAHAPTIQGRAGEIVRLTIRAIGMGDERLSYRANDWLMRTMARECARPRVTAVHSYEDCSLLQFNEAARRGKACIYDMPIGYYLAWERTQAALAKHYAHWLPSGGLPSARYVRPAQKRAEMELADLVLAPSRFVADTIRESLPYKKIAIVPYGIDAGWAPTTERSQNQTLTFLFVGQCSLRKGVPLLLQAWRAANLRDARLQLIGAWGLAEELRQGLPEGVSWTGALPREQLKAHYGSADVFVFPSYFEGRALVVGEAMAAALPVLTTRESGADDMIDDACGRIVPSGNLEALVEGLRWFAQNRGRLPALGRAARLKAAACAWDAYRQRVSDAVAQTVR